MARIPFQNESWRKPMVKSQPTIQMPPRKLCCSTFTMFITQVYTKETVVARFVSCNRLLILYSENQRRRTFTKL